MIFESKYTKEIYKGYKKHHHPMLAISALKNGSISIEYDDKEIQLTPNALVIFNPFENHKTINIDKNSSDYYTLYVDVNWCKKIQKNLFDTDEFFPIVESLIEESTLYHTFLALHEKMEEKEILLFMENIFIGYCPSSQDTQSITKENKTLKRIKDFMQSVDYKTVTLQNIANHVEVSPNYLIRLFKKEFGLSPHAYIINQKIYKAKILLEENRDISDVALEVGFYDQSHFHKAFKSVYAVTPKEFQINYVKG